MELNTLIAKCTAYDFKVMLEEKKPKSWLKSVSAFSNGLGGSLFFDIDKDVIVKGLDDVQHVCETISSRICDYMDPLPEVEMIPHDIDGLHILQLKVNSGHYTPYYYVGDGQRIALVRVGDESLPATAEQMVRLALKGSNKTYDSLHTDYKAEDYSFTILENAFKDRTKQEWDKKYLLSDAFETLDDNFCSLGINISLYKTLLDCFGNEGAKEILAALKDCSIDAIVRERFNTSQSYKVSLLREISTQEVIDDALLLIENEDAGNIFSFGYHFTPPYNTECIADWNVHFDFDAKKYKRVVAIIGENGVGKTQMLSDMLRDLTENNDDKFTHKPLLRNILVLCSSEFDAYQTIKKGNGNYNVRNLSVVQDDYTVDKLAGSILTILDRGTFLTHGDMLAVWQHYMELLKNQIGEEIDDLLIVPPKTEDNPYPKPYLNKKRLEQLVKQFSTGQLQLFTLITHVCAYIHLNSLVVLDEPEIHLHPRLVTDFFSCLGELLFYFGSYALVPTHSPLVIRECVNGNVYLMQRTNDDIVHIGLVPFRTFGQDLTTLYENVFGYEEKRTFYYGVIRSMTKNYRASYKRVVEQLEADGVRLDINSRSIIKEIFLKIEREADE